jgi:NAD(P)-dependent dehydrogenase (short-subunit alcohol dehydrogenase family)
VINHYNDVAGADALAVEVRGLGRRAIAIYADVGFAEQVEAMCAQAERELGGIDILVNNAGVQTWSPLLDLAEADWDRVIRTNLKGCFLCTQSAGRRIKARWRRAGDQHRVGREQGRVSAAGGLYGERGRYRSVH